MSGAPGLVLIDLQRAIDDPSWGTRNNPFAEARARQILELWLPSPALISRNGYTRRESLASSFVA